MHTGRHRLGHKALLALGCWLLSAWTAPGWADERLPALLDACLEAQYAGAASPAPEQPLSPPCPALQAALRHSPAATWLRPLPAVEMTFGQLRDLHYLLAGRSTDGEWVLDETRLDTILEATLIPRQTEEAMSWWDGLLAWLKDKLADENDTDLRWLERLVASLEISERTSRVIFYTALAIIVLLALAIVLNELYVAKVGLRRRQRTPGGAAVLAPAQPVPAPFDHIRHLPLQQQPAALLNHCIAALVAAQRLPDERSRTDRELTQYLRRHHQALATPFSQLSDCVEKTRFGGQPATAAMAERCFQTAAALRNAGES